MSHQRDPILVTGAAAGQVGGLGRKITELLLAKGHRVRALVHREDSRAEELRRLGADVVVGDLQQVGDVVRAMRGCRRVYFGFSASTDYLRATAIAATVAREQGNNLEVFVNMSQMTVSQMSTSAVTDSKQQVEHWLAEEMLEWSGLPVVTIRPTVFLENPLFLSIAAASIRATSTIRLPFGQGKTSPIFAGRDVAEVVAKILDNPTPHIGKIYELTGPASLDMNGIAAEFSKALGRKITYVDIPKEEFLAGLHQVGLPEHVEQHLSVMASLHTANRYDRSTDTVAAILGRPPSTIAEFVSEHSQNFTPTIHTA